MTRDYRHEIRVALMALDEETLREEIRRILDNMDEAFYRRFDDPAASAASEAPAVKCEFTEALLELLQHPERAL